MATAAHVDDCLSLGDPPKPVWRLADDMSALRLVGFTPAPPPCNGCVSGEERRLWEHLADEIDMFIGEAPPADTAPLF